MDAEISKIINKALDGGLLTNKELATLLTVEDLSEEGYAIRRAGRMFSERLSNHVAEVHGQIGIDIRPCPIDCRFCSFAASNKVFCDETVLTTEEAVAGVESMLEQGANAIFVMSTARYSIEDFCEMGKAIRKAIDAINPAMPMIANTADFDDDGARGLVEAGFQGVYHVIRMGEGEFTRVQKERRWQTIESAQRAGLLMTTCVEPIGPEHTPEEIAEKTIYTREMEPVLSGAMRRTPIPGSVLAKYGKLSYARLSTIVAAVALATGTEVPGNCTHDPSQLGIFGGANVVWAEVGSNPRDTEKETSNNRGNTVEYCRELYFDCEWEVLDGPSALITERLGK